MIFDRYYQLSAIFLVFLIFRDHGMFAVALSFLPILFIVVPFLFGLLIWQEISQRIGPKGQRNLVKLRWQLSRGPA